jgi:hypothetical protein
MEDEGKQFFFEKKNQKTFDTWGTRCIQRVPQVSKVFASFSKKKRFLASYGSISMAVGPAWAQTGRRWPGKNAPVEQMLQQPPAKIGVA